MYIKVCLKASQLCSTLNKLYTLEKEMNTDIVHTANIFYQLNKGIEFYVSCSPIRFCTYTKTN